MSTDPTGILRNVTCRTYAETLQRPLISGTAARALAAGA